MAFGRDAEHFDLVRCLYPAQFTHHCGCVSGLFRIEDLLQTYIVVVCQFVGFEQKLFRHFQSVEREELGHLFRFANVFDMIACQSVRPFHEEPRSTFRRKIEIAAIDTSGCVIQIYIHGKQASVGIYLPHRLLYAIPFQLKIAGQFFLYHFQHLFLSGIKDIKLMPGLE